MLKPFEYMLTEVIDYAGLFPPAKLEMEPAITNYANYRTLDDAWMLGRFICPASRLTELEKYRDNLFDTALPFRFSVLGSSGKDGKQFSERLQKDIAEIDRFLGFHGERVTVEAYETRLPDDMLSKPDAAALKALLTNVAARLSELPGCTVKPFYEIAFNANWREALSSAVRAISAFNLSLKEEELQPNALSAGFKMRCGGVEPHMYPTVEQVATVINTCLRFDVALKATAGLHHPVRHFNKAAKVTMHGFLNIIGAMILADVHGLDTGEIEKIVAEEDPQNFMFTLRAFAWQGMRASESDIRKTRNSGFISFGSCSFDEPREDLSNLKLL